MSTRRVFLQQSVLAAAGLAVSSSAFGKIFIGKKPHVLIIGAGFAGLSAARQLRQRGITYDILEARNRINGRVLTHQMDAGLNVELGAEWVGESHELVKGFCEQFGLPLDNNQLDTRFIYHGRYYDKGKLQPSPAWSARYEYLKREFWHLNDAGKAALDKLDWWRYLLNNGCDGRDLDIHELLDSTDFGESIRHVSALAAMEEYAYSTQPGASQRNEMDYKIRGGNAMLGNKLADEAGRGNIHLNHKVQRIVQAGDVTVYCSNGARFTADKIICTVPTFSLKKISWEPELSTEHTEAADELQYARINKNPLLFSERFWKDESFDLCTDTTPHYLYHATKGQRSAKGVLISYAIGDKAAVVDAQSENFRAEMIRQALQPHFGDLKGRLEKQTNYYWGNDEYSRGSYAMYGPGQWLRVRKALSQPHLHTHFAGEHLADWQGFMEGALATGKDAANIIAG